MCVAHLVLVTEGTSLPSAVLFAVVSVYSLNWCIARSIGLLNWHDYCTVHNCESHLILCNLNAMICSAFFYSCWPTRHMDGKEMLHLSCLGTVVTR